MNEPVIRLDGDDRSGTNTDGENLFINLAYTAQIRRIMVFAFIYEGVPNWAAANGVVTLFPATGPQIEVRLDESRPGSRICGIALLENQGTRRASSCTARSTTSTAASVPWTRPTAGVCAGRPAASKAVVACASVRFAHLRSTVISGPAR